jgi:hypothetical protein
MSEDFRSTNRPRCANELQAEGAPDIRTLFCGVCGNGGECVSDAKRQCPLCGEPMRSPPLGRSGVLSCPSCLTTRPLGWTGDAKAKSIIRENAEKDPTYCPYCGPCPGLIRMYKVEPFLWRCHCGAVHDERRPGDAPDAGCGGEPRAETSRWVPVTERLPGELQRVLMWNGEGSTAGTYILPPPGVTSDGFVADSRKGFGVTTHWMPLPQPPAAEAAKEGTVRHE